MGQKDYTEMWRGMGIDLEGHDELLGVLGQAYEDIFLPQQNRPQAMEYFDYVVSEIHGLRIEELLKEKEKGNLLVGTFCLYVPEEIILAAGGTSVGLCAGADIGTREAEKVLPRNTCALIKSFMGFKLASLCPYIEACDFVIGEATCDGKKKAYEILDGFKDTFVIEVPQMKTEEDRKLWLSEIYRLKDEIEKRSGKTITAQSLKNGIKTVNAKRCALQRLSAVRRARPVPMSGLDALLINQIQFYDDPPRFTAKLNVLCDELERRAADRVGVTSSGASRVVMSGCPMAAPNWKVPFVVEKSGGSIVAEESCVGQRNTRNLVPEDGTTVDEMLSQIADRYLKIDCACFTPNPERLDHIVDLARRFEADGVIHYSLQFCAPYTTEAYLVEKRLEKEKLPLLKVETDYSMEDLAQLETRVQAFLEVVGK